MARRSDKSWQFKFTYALTFLMLFLVFGFFYQSFLEIRKVKSVTVAIERITESRASRAKKESSTQDEKRGDAAQESVTP